jgi:hypothetical protein
MTLKKPASLSCLCGLSGLFCWFISKNERNQTNQLTKQTSVRLQSVRRLRLSHEFFDTDLDAPINQQPATHPVQ